MNSGNPPFSGHGIEHFTLVIGPRPRISSSHHITVKTGLEQVSVGL